MTTSVTNGHRISRHSACHVTARCTMRNKKRVFDSSIVDASVGPNPKESQLVSDDIRTRRLIPWPEDKHTLPCTVCGQVHSTAFSIGPIVTGGFVGGETQPYSPEVLCVDCSAGMNAGDV